ALAERRSELEAARRHLKHIVFIVKENRTLDTLFGRFPGADGATEGRTCDGRTVRLRRARDEEPDVEHHFVPAARAMDGGGVAREYCDDPSERAFSFRNLTAAQDREVFRWEENVETAARVHAYWIARWPCIDIRVLPDELQAHGISWRNYWGGSNWVQPLRM